MCSFAHASNSFWVGAGTVTHNFKRVQTDSAGEKTKTFSFTPTVLIGANIPVPFLNGISFLPGIGFSKYSNGGSDGETKSEIHLQYHFSYIFNSWFNLHYGLSNFITKISGKGGTKTLNNGTGTSVFYLPSTTKTSYTSSLDIVPEFLISNELALRTQISIERFLSSDRRSIAHLITLNYYF